MEEKAWQWECEVADHNQKAEREVNGGAQLTFSFVLSLGPPTI